MHRLAEARNLLSIGAPEDCRTKSRDSVDVGVDDGEAIVLTKMYPLTE